CTTPVNDLECISRPPRAVATGPKSRLPCGLAALQPQPCPPIAACRNSLIFMVKDLLRTPVLASESDFDPQPGASRNDGRRSRFSSMAGECISKRSRGSGGGVGGRGDIVVVRERGAQTCPRPSGVAT